MLVPPCSPANRGLLSLKSGGQRSKPPWHSAPRGKMQRGGPGAGHRRLADLPVRPAGRSRPATGRSIGRVLLWCEESRSYVGTRKPEGAAETHYEVFRLRPASLPCASPGIGGGP